MPEELKPVPVSPPVEKIQGARALKLGERKAWERLLREFEAANNAVESAGLLLLNLQTTYDFANQKGIAFSPVDPSLVNDFYETRNAIAAIKEAIRGAQDRRYGIKLREDGDIDILEAKDSGLEGIIIPIIVGILILAGAVGTTIWQRDKAQTLRRKYNDILKKTDDTLCKVKGSTTCKDWEATKKKKNYVRNKSLSESLQSGVGTISTGLRYGLMIGIPLAAFWLFGRRK